ncbi:MAG: adenylosuccinate lyase [Peptococcaceae bacterium]|nr:adenylosuccinate lyase [Peptococcaceae bacterium]
MLDRYESPLCTRYASKEMQEIFSSMNKFSTWRRLWIALAEAEQELGLGITDEQIQEMKAHIYDIDFERAAQWEALIHHDVMAHIHTYGEQCPKAQGIIHLGATSAYVGDNADIIMMTQAMELTYAKLLKVMEALADFAETYKDMPALAYTHFQAAQPTTVGKRASLWLMEFLMDLDQLEFFLAHKRTRGVKGTTGTQASFMELFNGDHEKIRRLDKLVAEKMGFHDTFPVTGQTCSRKLDSQVLNILSGISQSAYKMCGDIRLLQHMGEMEEPFDKKQVGSSAMAYKRNPMRSERVCSLARYVMVNALNPALTASSQWLERTLDDSANKRISIPESFLAVDGILELLLKITKGLVVYPRMIRRHLVEELPFMATEKILMVAVKKGGDRQELHERIRTHSMNVVRDIREEGRENRLLEAIAADPAFRLSQKELEEMLKPEDFVGRAPEQTAEFLAEYVRPRLAAVMARAETQAKTALGVAEKAALAQQASKDTNPAGGGGLKAGGEG